MNHPNRKEVGKMRATILIGLLVLPLALGGFAMSGMLSSEAGDLDPSFGVDGFVSVFPGGMGISSMALSPGDPDKLIAGGSYTEPGGTSHWAIVRFNMDGTLDTSFADGGRTLVLDSQSVNNEMKDFAVDPQGRIVATGSFNGYLTVIRLTPEGLLDSGFAQNGIFQMTLQNGIVGTALELQGDGKIVVGGYIISNLQYKKNVFLARLNPNGTLDTQSFGTATSGGRLGYMIDVINSKLHDGIRDGIMELLPDGKILVGGFIGYSLSGVTMEGWGIIRYTATGRDTTFGSNGYINPTTYGPYEKIGVSGLKVLSNGKILASGSAWLSSEPDCIAARYLANGTLDTTFAGGAGYTFKEIAGIANGGPLALQGDGKIVISLTVDSGNPVPPAPFDLQLAAFRLNEDGSHDIGFGSFGLSALAGAAPGTQERARAIVLDGSGDIIVGGSSGGTETSMAMAKFLADSASGFPSPVGLTATPTSTSSISLSWTPRTFDEEGFEIDRSANGFDWSLVHSTGQGVTEWSNTGLEPNTTYHYRVRAFKGADPIEYSEYSNIAVATTLDDTPIIEHTAEADQFVSGTPTGTYVDTHVADGTSQTIQEILSGGVPKNRYSYLEHRWVFNFETPVAPADLTFHLKAAATDLDNYGESFRFSWSADGSVFSNLVVVDKTTNFTLLTASMGTSSTPLSAIWIRVVDTNRVKGKNILNTISVDHMFLRQN